MSDSDKYERLYQAGRDVCGPPFAAFVDFFDRFDGRSVRVLDLGCGQGRDALFIARQGHSVLGVDLSATGVAQMVEDARGAGLAVEGVVADIVTFVPTEEFDVVLLDRILHMLPTDAARLAVLETVTRHTKSGGFVLIADTAKNMDVLADFFAEKPGQWRTHTRRKSYFFVQKARGQPARPAAPAQA